MDDVIVQEKLNNAMEEDNRCVLLGAESAAVAASVLSFLEAGGFAGVYASLRQPSHEAIEALEAYDINAEALSFLDFSPREGESDEHIHMKGPLDTDHLVRAILTALHARDAEPQFILVDAWDAVASELPLSEQVRFLEFLRELVRRPHEDRIVVLLANKERAEKIRKQEFLALDAVLTPEE